MSIQQKIANTLAGYEQGLYSDEDFLQIMTTLYFELKQEQQGE